MRRDVEVHRGPWKENPLWHYLEFIALSKVIRNFLFLWVARRCPFMPLKNSIYRAMGAKIGENVAFGLEASMEIFYPELVEIGDNTIIGYNVTLLTHEILTDEWRTGRIRIGRDCVVGANSTVLPGVTIADGTVVAAGSLVNCDVSGFVGGVPARPLERED